MVKRATLVEIMKFFAYDNTAQFRKDWSMMSDQDKAEIAEGIGEGSLTYYRAKDGSRL